MWLNCNLNKIRLVITTWWQQLLDLRWGIILLQVWGSISMSHCAQPYKYFTDCKTSDFRCFGNYHSKLTYFYYSFYASYSIIRSVELSLLNTVFIKMLELRRPSTQYNFIITIYQSYGEKRFGFILELKQFILWLATSVLPNYFDSLWWQLRYWCIFEGLYLFLKHCCFN